MQTDSSLIVLPEEKYQMTLIWTESKEQGILGKVLNKLDSGGMSFFSSDQTAVFRWNKIFPIE